MSETPSIGDLAAAWSLPEGQNILERLEQVIRPALWAGYFGKSTTRYVAGLQYHLGGAQDTRELADLAEIQPSDCVLDVCCFIGGPAIQLAHERGCRMTGIDINPNVITTAQRLAELSGLSHLLEFRVADAKALPFGDGTFTVVWNQCSLEHSEEWLKEFDRVLAQGGKLALTLELRDRGHEGPTDASSRWNLAEAVAKVKALGYEVTHADDITERDIEIGWKALSRKLSEHNEEFAKALGTSWVAQAQGQFKQEAQRMREGRYGNGRIVAVKKS